MKSLFEPEVYRISSNLPELSCTHRDLACTTGRTRQAVRRPIRRCTGTFQIWFGKLRALG